MAYSSGSDGWFVSAGSYVFPIVFGLCAVVIVLGIVLWVLKLLGVIAQLPFALDRKLNPPS